MTPALSKQGEMGTDKMIGKLLGNSEKKTIMIHQTAGMLLNFGSNLSW